MDGTARKIHLEAVKTREEGDFLGALKLDFEALLEYQKEGDQAGFAEALADQSLTLRHLCMQTEDKNYLILAKNIILTGVEIAEKSGDKKALAVPYFNLAKVYDDLGELDSSIENYKKAVENINANPPDTHNRPGIRADYKIHLATAEANNGDKSAINRLKQGLSELEEADEDSFNKNIWLSGAYMNLIMLLKDSDTKQAKEYMQKVRDLVNSDGKLKIRAEQLDKMMTKFPELLQTPD